MITVHILEANLKVLPGKITLLITEPLTHSLPILPGQRSSHLQREGEGGHASCPAMLSQSSAQQKDGH